MIDDIIKLVDLSIEDGILSEEDFKVILKKALSSGMSEEELNLIINKRIKSKNNQVATLKVPKESETDSKSYTSFLPYILAGSAIASTFLNWIEASAKSSYEGYSGGYNLSFSGWWGGYGVSILFVFILGSFLYYKKIKYYWIAGVLAIINAIYIYSALTNANVSTSYNFGEYGSGSASAGYTLQFGFYIFIIVSALYSLTGLSLLGKKKVGLGSGVDAQYSQNLKSGRIALLLSLFASMVCITFAIGSEENDLLTGAIISAIIHVGLWLIFLFINVFTHSSVKSGIVLLILPIILLIVVLINQGSFMLVSYVTVFPVTNLLFNQLLKKNAPFAKAD